MLPDGKTVEQAAGQTYDVTNNIQNNNTMTTYMMIITMQ